MQGFNTAEISVSRKPGKFFPAPFFRGLRGSTGTFFQVYKLLFYPFVTFPELFPPGAVPDIKENLLPYYTPVIAESGIPQSQFRCIQCNLSKVPDCLN